MYGSFNFGKFKILKMTSISGECCGFGRDQLVYNLQYTMFHYLQNKIYADIKPTENTYILTKNNVSRYLTMPLEKSTFQRSTAQNSNRLIFPKYMELKKFFELKQKPKSAFFIDYPNFPYETSVYKKMQREYAVKYYKKYDFMGYSIDIYTLTRP